MQKNTNVVEIKLESIIERSAKLEEIRLEYHSYLDLMNLQCSHSMVLWRTLRLVSISLNSSTMI
nr:MAG TPA_asm: hypothetical protein [Bacteriophage sp.]